MKLIKAYHGTNTRFSQFDHSKARIANDFYGGGVAYFTDTIDVAKTYASNMFRRLGGDKFIYEVELKFQNLFDVDEMYTGDILRKLIGSNTETFARGAGLMKLGDDKYALASKLKSGDIELTGDQVFRGLSNGMQNTTRARETLKSCGFDGLRHNGGVNMGAQRHNVYLAYEARSIRIMNRFIVSNIPVPASAFPEVYTFIH